MDKVSDVAGVRHNRPDRVLGLCDNGPFVHPAHTGCFVDDVLQGVRLLQLAEVIVLHSRGMTQR